MPTSKVSSPRGASSPERLLDILLLFETESQITIQQISERFGSSRSSTYRDLGFLKSRGFIEESGAPGTYHLGLAVERLATSPGYSNHLAGIGRVQMGVLADLTGESVVLCRRAGARVALLVGIDSRQMLRVSVQAADNQPLHRGSFGKVLLAFQSAHVIDAILAQTPLSDGQGRPIVADALRGELAVIHQRGYAVSDSEVEDGTRSVAVPVMTREGQVIASIAVAGPSARLPVERTQELLDQLSASARAIADAWSGLPSSPRFVPDAARSRGVAAALSSEGPPA